MQMRVGADAAPAIMRSIELLGTVVAPAVRSRTGEAEGPGVNGAAAAPDRLRHCVER